MSGVRVTDEARELLDRVRTLLPDKEPREVRMFGAIAVMVDEAMVVAINKDGSMLVRVDPTEDAELIKRPHAARAEMGAGRSMGEGWIRVGSEALGSDQDLGAWVDCATRFLSRKQTKGV